eukprot:5249366-Amphidinium_carterae.1
MHNKRATSIARRDTAKSERVLFAMEKMLRRTSRASHQKRMMKMQSAGSNCCTLARTYMRYIQSC